MASATDGFQLVGFVCPICKNNLASAELLLAHYATHKEDDCDPVCYRRNGIGSSMNKIYDKTIELQTTSYDRVFKETSEIRRPATISEADPAYSFNIGKSLKKIFGKAVELQTTTLDRVFGGPTENKRPVTISEAELRSKDLLELFNGKTDKEKVKLTSRSRTDHFIELRSAKINNQRKETDIILENLKKYLNNDKSDKSLWKLIKKADTVIAGDVCSKCKKHFKLMRRKHNCKLCEIALCDNCSVFVDANIAKSILSPLDVVEQKTLKPLRHCEDCQLQLQVIKSRIGGETYESKLIEIYKEMQNLKRQLSKTVITYKEVHESLVKGKTIHDLSHAAMVREHIGKRGREIAVLGKVIGELPAPVGSRQAKLYTTIQKATNDFVMDLLALPKVPTPEAVEEVRLRRRLSYCTAKSGLEWDEII